MQCNFLIEKKCVIQEDKRTENSFTPSQEDINKYCETEKFDTCPRLKTYIAIKPTIITNYNHQR